MLAVCMLPNRPPVWLFGPINASAARIGHDDCKIGNDLSFSPWDKMVESRVRVANCTRLPAFVDRKPRPVTTAVYSIPTRQREGGPIQRMRRAVFFTPRFDHR